MLKELEENFVSEKRGSLKLVLRKDFRDELLEAGVEKPRELVSRFREPGANPLGRAEVAFVPLKNRRMALREFRHGGGFRFLTGGLFFSGKRVEKELVILDFARKAGLPVPEPLGGAVIKAGPFNRMFLFSEVIENAEDFVTYLSREHAPEMELWRKILHRTAEEVRRMHDAGIHHGDLHVRNLLVRLKDEKDPEIFIIDFDKSAVKVDLTVNEREQNLMRLGRSVDKLPRPGRVTRSDMLRLFRAYLAAGPSIYVDEKAFADRFGAHRAMHARSRKLPGQSEKFE